MTTPIRDVNDAPELDDSGDLVSSTGLAALMQRAIRLLMMTPGEMLLRPTLGGGLKQFANKPVTAAMLQRATNQAAESLQALEEIESFEIQISRGNSPNTISMDLTINAHGASLTRRDILIEA